MSGINDKNDVFLNIYNCLEYVPVASSATSLYNLARKKFTLPTMQKSEIQASHYYTQLDKKSVVRMVLLTIPVLGNLSVGMYDLVKYSKKQPNKHNYSHEGVPSEGENKRADEELDKDRKQMVDAIKKNPRAIIDASKALKADSAFILEAIKINPLFLIYADSHLKINEKFMLDAVKENPSVLHYASPTLKANKTFMLDVLKINENALEELPAELKADDAFMLDVVALHAKAFKLADTKLKTDKFFVMESIKRNVNVFSDVDRLFKSDAEIVRVALQEGVRPLQFADKKLKANDAFMLAVLKQHPEGLRYADEKLRRDQQFVLKAVKENPEVVKHLDKELWNTKLVPFDQRSKEGKTADRLFMIHLVRENPLVLKYAHLVDVGGVNYKDDQAVVITAVKQDGMLLEYASAELQGIPRVILAAVRQNKDALPFAINRPLERNEESEKFIEEMNKIYPAEGLREG